jgi:hypothetical protein
MVDNKQVYDEKDPKIQALINAAENEARELLRFVKKGEGFCHVLWEAKKRILKEKYNLDWKTPQELNPYVMFD